MRTEWDGQTGIPDLLFLASVMDEIWPQLCAYLVETGQCVEMEGGELLTYEQYQALYERTQQLAQEQKHSEVPFSFATLEYWHQQFVESAQSDEERLHEGEGNTQEGREPMVEAGAWSMAQAQEMASVVRGKLAGDMYAVLAAATRGDRSCLLIYSRVQQQVVAQLTREEDVEQVVACLHEQGHEHKVTVEATACHGNQMMQEKPDDELAC